MVINTTQIETLIADTEITGYSIYKATGFSQIVISRFRQDPTRVYNLTLHTVKQLQTYINEHKKELP